MNSTIEQQRQRVETEMSKIIEDLDKSHLRKFQVDMHYCSAKCCENTSSSLESVQRCIQDCSTPLNHAQNYIHKELEEFQGRLQRCVMTCNDDIKVQMPPAPSENEIAKYTSQFERCAIKCVDKTIELIPGLYKSMKTVLGRGPKNIPSS